MLTTRSKSFLESVFVAVLLAAAAGAQEPAPVPAPAPAAAAPAAPPVRINFRPVARETIEARVRKVARKDRERQAALKALLEEAGCTGEKLTEQKVGKSPPNVICTLPGSGPQAIIVGAHFDTVAQSSGALDNWTGAAMLANLYESLSAEPRRHTFIFVGFTDEEDGLVGSRHYAKKMPKEDVARTSAMVNLDTLGLSEARYWKTRSDETLEKYLLRVAVAMRIHIGAMNVEQVGSTDSESFRAKEIRVITIHSVTPENFGWLHGPQDRIENLNLDHYYNSYRLTAAYLAYIDQMLDIGANAPSGPAPAVP